MTFYQRVYEGMALDPERPSDLDFQAIFSLVDEQALRDAARERVTWNQWDKESPINGVPAEVVKEQPDYAGGEAYFVYVDGQLTYFQPHRLGEGLEPITPEELPSMAQDHADEIIESLVQQQAVEFVRQQYQRMLSWRTQQEFAARQAAAPSERRAP